MTKLFQHPILKSQKLITSEGVIELDAKGQAQVTEKQFDHLMKIPANSALQAKADLNKDNTLSENEFNELDLNDLRGIAKERKVPFTKNTTKEELVSLLTLASSSDETKKPPFPPPPGGSQG
jgi:hypothetical protein